MARRQPWMRSSGAQVFGLLDYLGPLHVLEDDGRVPVRGQQEIKEPRLWLAGYGDLTGPGSATLMGVARTARDLARDLIAALAA